MTANSKFKDNYYEFLTGTTSVLKATASTSSGYSLTLSSQSNAYSDGLFNAFITSIDFDSFGNIYVSGYYRIANASYTTINNLDGSPSSLVFQEQGFSSGYLSNFIVKWNSAGIVQSMTTFACVNSTYGRIPNGSDLQFPNTFPNKVICSQDNSIYWIGAYLPISSSTPIYNFRTDSNTMTSYSIVSPASSSKTNTYIIKYDSDGNTTGYSWLNCETSALPSVIPHGSYINGTNLYIITAMRGDTYIRNISTTPTTVATISAPGSSDYFINCILKYNSDNFDSVSIISISQSHNYVRGLCFDSKYLYAIGDCISASEINIFPFGIGNTIGQTSTNINNGASGFSFIVAYNISNGIISSYASIGVDSIVYSCINISGCLYVVGAYASASTVPLYNFGTSVTTSPFSLPTTGSDNNRRTFIVKYNTNGCVDSYTVIPVNILPASIDTIAFTNLDITNDAQNNIYISSYCYSLTPINVPVYNFVSSGSLTSPFSMVIDKSCRYIIKYDSYGSAISYTLGGAYVYYSPGFRYIKGSVLKVGTNNTLWSSGLYVTQASISNFTSGTATALYTLGPNFSGNTSGGSSLTNWASDGTLNYTTRPLLKSVQNPVDAYDVANKNYADGSFEYIIDSGSPITLSQGVKSVLKPDLLCLPEVGPTMYNSSPCSVCTDTVGNVYIIGTFFGAYCPQYNKDGSFNKINSNTTLSMYIMKYFNGTLIGTTYIYGASPSTITTDTSNYVYASGSYSSSSVVYIYDFSSSSILGLSRAYMPIGEKYFTIKWSSEGLFDSYSVSESYVNKSLLTTTNTISNNLYPITKDNSGNTYSAINSSIGIVKDFTTDNTSTGLGYPYGPSGTIGFFSQIGTKLVGTGNSGAPIGQGFSVSLYKDTLAVGGYGDNSSIGATWIYVRNTNGTWSQQGSKLVGSGYVGTSNQGSVSLYEDTLAVGGYGDNGYIGATWIFVRNGSGASATWTQQGSKLIGSGTAGTQCGQGYSVSLYKDTLAVGGHLDSGSIGATWIFTRNTAGIWSQVGSKLVGTGYVGSYVYQGFSVSLYKDTLAIGGYLDNSTTGATWVFTRNSAGAWSQQGSKLVGTGTEGDECYQGVSVSLYNDTLAIGGFGDNNNVGATWIFNRDSNTWTQQGSKLVGTGIPGSQSYQGTAVSLYYDTLIVGGIGNGSGMSGASWSFVRNADGVWTQQSPRIIGAGDTAGAGNQGSSVSIYKNTVAVGGNYNSGNLGCTWIFENNTTGLTKYNPSGKVIGFSPIQNFISKDIKCDSQGFLYCAGVMNNQIVSTEGSMSIPVYDLNSTYTSTFTIPYTNGGVSIIKWASTGVPNSYTYIQSASNPKMTIDSQNNLYCVGTYNSSVSIPVYNFMNSTTTVSQFSLPATNVPRTFLIKWNSVGLANSYTFIGNSTGSFSGAGSACNLCTDANNSIYLSSLYTEATSTVPLIDMTPNTTTQNSLSAVLPASSSSNAGIWTTTGSLNVGRRAFTVTKLLSGSVFVAGGFTSSGTSSATSTCEIYTPSTGIWTTTGSLSQARQNLNSTLLFSGQVLIVGGTTGGTNATAVCEVYNPDTGLCTTTGSLNIARSTCAIQTLYNGQVLVAGGTTYPSTSIPTSSCELYSPATGSWTTTGSMVFPRTNFNVYPLPNGNAIAIGGSINTSNNTVPQCEIYSVSAGTWSVTTSGSLNTGTMTNGFYSYASCTLQNSRIFITGGVNGSTTGSTTYDPTGGYFISNIGNPTVSSITYSSAVCLSNGSVLLAGSSTGTALGSAGASSFLYNPSTNAWTTVGTMSTGHQNGYSNKSNLVLLNNGYPMIIGGFNTVSSNSLATCELFNPLFANNTLIKYNSGGSVIGYQTIPNGSLYSLLPIDNSMTVDISGYLNYSKGLGASANIYDVNTTSTYNTLSRATISPILNSLYSIVPSSSVYTKWSTTDDTVNVDPYYENFNVNLPSTQNNTPLLKTIIPVTPNYNYIGETATGVMSLNNTTQLFFDGYTWNKTSL